MEFVIETNRSMEDLNKKEINTYRSFYQITRGIIVFAWTEYRLLFANICIFSFIHRLKIKRSEKKITKMRLKCRIFFWILLKTKKKTKLRRNGFGPWLCFSYLTRSSENITLCKARPQIVTRGVLIFRWKRESCSAGSVDRERDCVI